jgi:hypothetical protein
LFFSVAGALNRDEPDTRENELEWTINIRLEIPATSQYSNSRTIQLQVIGPTRDWVVLTASELEDRIKLTNAFAPTKYLSHPATPFVALFLLIFILIGSLLISPTPVPIYQKLEMLRTEGKIIDAVDAVIATERLKTPNKARIDSFLTWALVGITIFGVALAFLPKIAKLIGRPYVFLWGEYIAIHQRRKAIESTIWIVVILGLIVGVAATWTSKTLGL